MIEMTKGGVSYEQINLNKICKLITYSTKRQNKLWSRFCKVVFVIAIDVPALLPCAILPRQPRGTHKKQLTKPTPEFILSVSRWSIG